MVPRVPSWLGPAALLIGAATALGAGVWTVPATGLCEESGRTPCGSPAAHGMVQLGGLVLIVGLVLLLIGLIAWWWDGSWPVGTAPRPRLPLPVQWVLVVLLVDLLVMWPMGAALALGRYLFVGLACWWLLGLAAVAVRPARAHGLGVRPARGFAVLLALAAVAGAVAVGWASGLGLDRIQDTEDTTVGWGWPVLLIGHLGVPLLLGLVAARFGRRAETGATATDEITDNTPVDGSAVAGG